MHASRLLLCAMLLSALHLHGMEQKVLPEKKEDKQSAYDYAKYPLLAYLPRILCELIEHYGAFERHGGWPSDNYATTSLAFSYDGQCLATGSENGTVYVWDVVTGKKIHTCTEQTRGIRAVAFSPDGNRLASRSSDGTLYVLDCKTWQNKKIHTGYCNGGKGVIFDHTSQYLANINSCRIDLWDCVGKKIGTYTPACSVASVAFSPDGNYVLGGLSDGSLSLWNRTDSKEVCTYRAHSQPINNIAFTSNGRYLATASDDMTVRVLDLASADSVPMDLKHSNLVSSVSISPNDTWLVSTMLSEAFIWEPKIWNLKNGELVQELNLGYYIAPVAAFNPHKRNMFAIAGENGIEIYTRPCLVPPTIQKSNHQSHDDDQKMRARYSKNLLKIAGFVEKVVK
jgi:WD40 repeat protein